MRVGKRCSEIHVAPTHLAGAEGSIEPNGAGRDVQRTQAVGVGDHFFLGVGGTTQIVMVVVSPPDAAEGPRRRHGGGPSEPVVTVQKIGVAGTVDNVVFQLRTKEGKACLSG